MNQGLNIASSIPINKLPPYFKAALWGTLGTLYLSLGDLVAAKTFYQNRLDILDKYNISENSYGNALTDLGYVEIHLVGSRKEGENKIQNGKIICDNYIGFGVRTKRKWAEYWLGKGRTDNEMKEVVKRALTICVKHQLWGQFKQLQPVARKLAIDLEPYAHQQAIEDFNSLYSCITKYPLNLPPLFILAAATSIILENTLKAIAKKKNIPLGKKWGLRKLNNRLHNKGIYDRFTFKKIDEWREQTRNLVIHGEYGLNFEYPLCDMRRYNFQLEYTLDDIKNMHKWIHLYLIGQYL